MEVCRICLATDKKMYHLDNNHKQLYGNITGLTFVLEDQLPKNVCWECRHYLAKYFAFKRKAVTSQSILTEILNSDGLITKTALKSVNCKLQSSLIRTEVLYLYINGEKEDDSLESELKIKNESNDSNINTCNDGKEDLINDFIDNSQVCSDDSLENNFILTPKYKAKDNGGEDSVIENKDVIIKAPKNSRVKRKRKLSESEVIEDNKKIIKEKRACAKRKKVYMVKKNKNMKSPIDEIDKNILMLTEYTIDEQIAEIQNRKETDNYKNSPYKCENCFKGFIDEVTFERHMEKHSESRGTRVCPLCNTRYKKQNDLTRHVKSHMQKITCLQCNFCTRFIEVAKQHQNYHAGKQFQCTHCLETFPHQTTYLSHLRVKHPSNVVCQQCGCSFLNDRGLQRHVKLTHRSHPKPILADGPQCARCDIRFACQDALDNHELVSHADERAGAAGQPTRNAYNNEYRTFYKRTDQRYMCEICGQVLQTTNDLCRHQCKHSDTKKHKCDRCGKLFTMHNVLLIHQKHHCGARVDYPCSVCGKNFSNKGNMRRHMAIHKGYSYKCEMCDKVFNCQGNRKNHVDFVHKKKPWPKRNRGPRRRPEKQTEGMLQNPSCEIDMEEECNTP